MRHIASISSVSLLLLASTAPCSARAIATDDGTSIVVGNTCRFSAESREDDKGRRGSAVLGDVITRTPPKALVVS